MEKVNKTTEFIMNYLLICENIKDYRIREFERFCYKVRKI